MYVMYVMLCYVISGFANLSFISLFCFVLCCVMLCFTILLCRSYLYDDFFEGTFFFAEQSRDFRFLERFLFQNLENNLLFASKSGFGDCSAKKSRFYLRLRRVVMTGTILINYENGFTSCSLGFLEASRRAEDSRLVYLMSGSSTRLTVLLTRNLAYSVVQCSTGPNRVRNRPQLRFWMLQPN